MKQIHISEELFVQLVKYHLCDVESDAEAIKKALQTKFDRVIDRMTYTTYKTAPTEEEREGARQKYLDRKGYHEDFRW